MKVKLKDVFGDPIGTIEAPRMVLNDLALALEDAALLNEQQNYRSFAKQYNNLSQQIYDRLKEVGFYGYND